MAHSITGRRGKDGTPSTKTKQEAAKQETTQQDAVKAKEKTGKKEAKE